MTRVLGWLACAVSVVLLVVAMVTGTVPASAAAVARVTDAWVRLPAVPGRPAAAYFTLEAPRGTELTGVTSPLARVELHGMSMAGDVMRMDRLPEVKVGDAPVRFAPGGKHLMLFALAPSVRAGGTLPLTFAFRDGTTTTVRAAVHAAGEDTMPGMPR